MKLLWGDRHENGIGFRFRFRGNRVTVRRRGRRNWAAYVAGPAPRFGFWTIPAPGPLTAALVARDSVRDA